MPRTLKNRIASALLLAVMLAPLRQARSADAPLGKALLASSEQSKVIPRRGPRLLSRQEIFQAIQNDLAQKGIAARAELRPEDLKIQASPPALQADTGLVVKNIRYSPIRRDTVFELWTSLEPQYLPFEVTTRRNPPSLGMWSTWDSKLPVGMGGIGPTKGQVAGPAASNLPALVKPGRPATLIMQGQNIRITTAVEALQPGSKGQCILVRDLATSRVIRAEVMDEGLLQTSL